jgi:hypothetical protein
LDGTGEHYKTDSEIQTQHISSLQNLHLQKKDMNIKGGIFGGASWMRNGENRGRR